jgi:hypothetical protein
MLRVIWSWDMLAVKLKQLAKKYIKENIKPEIVCFAEEGRPEGLFTPCYYSDLYQIEYT